MERLQTAARFPRIPPEKLSEFKRLAAQALEKAKDEAGLLQYDWFFSPDETVCVLLETYASSDAVLAHMAHMGELSLTIDEIAGGCEFEMFGSPSAELRKSVSDFGPAVFSYFQGK